MSVYSDATELSTIDTAMMVVDENVSYQTSPLTANTSRDFNSDRYMDGLSGKSLEIMSKVRVFLSRVSLLPEIHPEFFDRGLGIKFHFYFLYKLAQTCMNNLGGAHVLYYPSLSFYSDHVAGILNEEMSKNPRFWDANEDSILTVLNSLILTGNFLNYSAFIYFVQGHLSDEFWENNIYRNCLNQYFYSNSNNHDKGAFTRFKVSIEFFSIYRPIFVISSLVQVDRLKLSPSSDYVIFYPLIFSTLIESPMPSEADLEKISAEALKLSAVIPNFLIRFNNILKELNFIKSRDHFDSHKRSLVLRAFASFIHPEVYVELGLLEAFLVWGYYQFDPTNDNDRSLFFSLQKACYTSENVEFLIAHASISSKHNIIQ